MRNRLFRVYVHSWLLWGDRRTIYIYIYIQFAHGCTVYVGLAQARPNYGTSVTRNYNIPSDLYGHKREIFYCAFSCLGYGPYIHRSNLANCKFTLVLVIKQATVPRRGRLPRRRERDRARYQLNSARTSY